MDLRLNRPRANTMNEKDASPYYQQNKASNGK